MTAADAILAPLVAAWRAGERVPLWDALCEASATGEPVEEWLAVLGNWCLYIGWVLAATLRRENDRWSGQIDAYGHYRVHWGSSVTLANAKAAARAAAVASLRGEA